MIVTGALSNYSNSAAEPDIWPVVIEPEDRAIGRSRGGLTTKVHALTDGRAARWSVVDRRERHRRHPVRAAHGQVAGPAARAWAATDVPGHVLGDKGYSSRANRELLRRRGISHTIPEPADQQANRRRRGRRGGRPVGFDKTRCKQRNVVERGFCQC